MFEWLKKKDTSEKQRRPSFREKIKGRLGYPEAAEGIPALEFMSELEPPWGLDNFRKMKMNDPIVGGLLMQIENIMRQLRWGIDGPNAAFVRDMLTNLPGGISWTNYYMASAFAYGFYIGEEVWQVDGSKIYLKDIAPRFQPTITKIGDENDDVVQQTETGIFRWPLEKSVHHLFFSETRSPYGTSILRHLYKPYYYKISIEASETTGIDRDLTGMPVMTSPEGFDFTSTDPNSPTYDPTAEETLNWALDIVQNVRMDTQTGIVKPYGWELEIIRGENRTNIPTNDIISRYNTEMAAGVLENFISLGAFATTNNANTEVNVKNFLRACDTFGEVMAATYNNIIGQIAEYNGLKNQPRFYFNRVNRESLETLATFFTRLTSAGVVTPTTTLEEELMRSSDFTYDSRDEVKKSVPAKS